jgi:hypothetical protein
MRKSATRKQLVSFGLVFAGFFLLVGLYPILHGGLPRRWSVGTAAAFAVVATVFPGLLRLPYAGWMAFGEALAWVNTRIILTVIFFVVFLPAGIIMRIFGKDPMTRRFDIGLGSYRVRRTSRPASHMDHQF